jgi:hypothetical protein
MVDEVHVKAASVPVRDEYLDVEVLGSVLAQIS